MITPRLEPGGGKFHLFGRLRAWNSAWDDKAAMTRTFAVGDHVTWNSEAGHVTGKITKIHRKDFDYKVYTHHASREDPQYEIKSDKSDHVAVHKGAALRLIDR